MDEPGVASESTEPAGAVVVRRARPEDAGCARLVFEAAPGEYTQLAGDPVLAYRALKRVWATPGHSASFQFAWVAEEDRKVVGLLIGFPARERLRLHAALLRHSLYTVPRSRWLTLAAALLYLWRQTPRPPADSFYVMTVAVAPSHRRRGIASALGRAAEVDARSQGFARFSAHTGSNHTVAHRALQGYGFKPVGERRDTFVLYVWPSTEP